MMTPQDTSTVTRATLADVARAAGVSRQTVSNALHKPDVVRPATLRTVLDHVERLGYRPNSAARSMRRQRAGAVGVELDAVDAFPSDVAQSYLVALTTRAPRHDCHLVPFSSPDRFPSLSGYQEMARRQLVDAFVLADTHEGDPRPAWLQRNGIPFAAFGRVYDDPTVTSWADVDSRAGTSAAVSHLIEQGYDTIGYLGWPDGVLARERRAGWEDTCRALGRQSGPEQQAAQDLPDAVSAARALLDHLTPGDAVVCASDVLALGVLTAARARGWEPGRDLGIVGFDGSVHARLHGLASVRQPLEDIADHLLGLVHAQLEGASPPAAGELFTPTLMPGRSAERSTEGTS